MINRQNNTTVRKINSPTVIAVIVIAVIDLDEVKN